MKLLKSFLNLSIVFNVNIWRKRISFLKHKKLIHFEFSSYVLKIVGMDYPSNHCFFVFFFSSKIRMCFTIPSLVYIKEPALWTYCVQSAQKLLRMGRLRSPHGFSGACRLRRKEISKQEPCRTVRGEGISETTECNNRGPKNRIICIMVTWSFL